MRARIGLAVVGVMLMAGRAAVGADAAAEQWWGDLGQMEPAMARAVLGLAGKPEDAVALMRERLVPLTITPEEVRGLIKELGSADEKVWRPAFEKLVYFDPRLAIGIKPLMEEVTEEPARHRLVEVLGDRAPGSVKWKTIELKEYPREGGGVAYQFSSPSPRGQGSTVWEAEDRVERLSRSDLVILKRAWARAIFGLVILKHIGTAEAWAVVERMATGDGRAEPTVVAKRLLAERGKAVAATQGAMEEWWADLAESGVKGEEALLSFAGQPEEAVAYFKPRLLPLALTEAEAQKLVDALGSEKESEWRAAFEKMRYFDPRLGIDLPTLMSEVDGEQRARLVDALTDADPGKFGTPEVELISLGKGQYYFQGKGMSWGAEPSVAKLESGRFSSRKLQWRRAARAEVLLGKIGGPEAMGILKAMASGNAEALPTRVATEELAGKHE